MPQQMRDLRMVCIMLLYMAIRKEDKVDRMKKCDLNKIMFLAEIFEVKSEKDEIVLFDAIRYLDMQEPIDEEKMRK